MLKIEMYLSRSDDFFVYYLTGRREVCILTVSVRLVQLVQMIQLEGGDRNG